MTFGRVGALGLPYFSCIPANMEVRPGKDIELPNKLMLMPAPVEDWRAELVASFISAATGLDIGEASELEGRSPFLPVIALFVLGSIAVLGYKVANSSLYVCFDVILTDALLFLTCRASFVPFSRLLTVGCASNVRLTGSTTCRCTSAGA